MNKKTSSENKKTSSDIVDLFTAPERVDEFGCVRLTAKQVRWLASVLNSERRGMTGINRKATVHDTDNHYYDFVIYPNGAGFLRPA